MGGLDVLILLHHGSNATGFAGRYGSNGAGVAVLRRNSGCVRFGLVDGSRERHGREGYQTFVRLLPTPGPGWRVLPGFMPGIHDFLLLKRWIAGTSPPWR